LCCTDGLVYKRVCAGVSEAGGHKEQAIGNREMDKAAGKKDKAVSGGPPGGSKKQSKPDKSAGAGGAGKGKQQQQQQAKSKPKPAAVENEDVKREQKLQAVLLADSFNKAFRPITLECPKVLLPLVNMPMMEYTIEFLAQNGVEEVNSHLINIVCFFHLYLMLFFIAYF
jgi:hypothetical protein